MDRKTRQFAVSTASPVSITGTPSGDVHNSFDIAQGSGLSKLEHYAGIALAELIIPLSDNGRYLLADQPGSLEVSSQIAESAFLMAKAMCVQGAIEVDKMSLEFLEEARVQNE